MDGTTPKKRKIEESLESFRDTPSKKKRINISQKSQEYFSFKEDRVVDGIEKRFFVCTLCSKEINGTHTGNLSSHLQTHKEFFVKFNNRDQSIDEKRLLLLLDCVEMVTINARSFTHLNDSSLHSMLNEKLCELESAGVKLNLNDPNLLEVKDCMKNISQKIREKICNEVKGLPLSLMVDIVSKRGRSILGFSLQYILDGKQRIRSIGMINLEKAHTATYLTELIVARLKEFEIKLCQILTITTDNGSNMLKMVRDIKCKLEEMQRDATSDGNSNETNHAQVEGTSSMPNTIT